MPKIRPGTDPTFDTVSKSGYHMRRGSARPKNVHEIRVNEVNTQRYAAGSRGGTTMGQGPALDMGSK